MRVEKQEQKKTPVYVPTDAGDHWLDNCTGGVQGNGFKHFGPGIMGVYEPSLKHRRNDARCFPPLHPHHCHDKGNLSLKLDLCLAISFVRLSMCVCLQVNRIVAMKLSDKGTLRLVSSVIRTIRTDKLYKNNLMVYT